ncbi:MAG: ABC transporter ATP-binding protein [Lachnospiraceae bacterium]|nr:ABC transporter ATP-binding protein [Lachnospiraceae bacterium]
MLQIIKKIGVLLDKKQKRTMKWLVVMMILGAALETASLGALIPVIQAIMQENAMESNALLAWLYKGLGCTSENQFVTILLVTVIVLFVVKNIYLYWQQKFTLKFVYGNQFDTSEKMMKSYLRKNYEFYLNADTAVVQRNITSDVNNMYGLILALLTLVSEGIVFVCLAAMCFFNDAVLTVLIAGVLCVLLLVIEKVLKPVMRKAGEDNQNFYSGLFKWISQTVQGIKEVKIAGKEKYFVDEYVKCGHGYVNAVQKYSLYNNIPRLLIEAVCIGCLLGYIIFMMLVMGAKPQDMSDSLTALAAVALRLLPCVNRINNQINNISYFEPFLMGVSDTLQQDIGKENTDMSFAKEEEKLEVKETIRLEGITYAYPGTEKLIFNQANMEIPVGKAVGIVGTSGAGKTTVVDILLGLLKTKEGKVYADGVDVDTRYRGWLRNIGYIPQMIFMLDDTIRKNVAFGVPEDEIDEKRVWEVLKEAQLDEFIRTLPEGLDTGIGERGIRLSGGQRQRIGIARALYNDPEVLILDEATSALDNDTEAAIMESINHFHGKKTLIIIAHRLQTIEKCDMVYRVEDGKAVLEK